jgi:predicted MFS family arabinose efflux permease
VLIAARVAQGVGAAIIFPMGLALVALSFPPRLSGFAIGVVAGCAAFTITIGPLVGGALIDTLGWRWRFLVNPFSAIPVFVVVLLVWREPERERQASVDIPGLVTLSAGLAGVVLGLMEGDNWGWDSPLTLGSIGVGLASLAIFAAHELLDREPLIDLRLLGHGTAASGNLIVFTAQSTKAAQIVFLAIYFQEVLGMSALEAGLALLPAGILGLFASFVPGRVIDRVGARIPGLAGLALTALSMAWIAAGVESESYALLLVGVSIQVLFAAPMTAITLTTPASAQGETSGIISTSQMVGGTFGIAIFSALISAGLSYATVFFVGAGFALAVLASALPFFDRRQEQPVAAPATG